MNSLSIWNIDHILAKRISLTIQSYPELDWSVERFTITLHGSSAVLSAGSHFRSTAAEKEKDTRRRRDREEDSLRLRREWSWPQRHCQYPISLPDLNLPSWFHLDLLQQNSRRRYSRPMQVVEAHPQPREEMFPYPELDLLGLKLPCGMQHMPCWQCCVRS